MSASRLRLGEAAGHVAVRTPAPVEDGGRPEPPPVVACTTPKLSGRLSGLTAQLTQAGSDRRVVVRNPASHFFRAHDSSLPVSMPIKGAAIVLCIPGRRAAPLLVVGAAPVSLPTSAQGRRRPS